MPKENRAVLPVFLRFKYVPEWIQTERKSYSVAPGFTVSCPYRKDVNEFRNRNVIGVKRGLGISSVVLLPTTFIRLLAVDKLKEP